MPAATPPVKGAVRRALRRALARALRQPADLDPHRAVLELFSGKGHLCRAVVRQGRHSLPLDIIDNPLFDILSGEAWRVIKGWITAGIISAVWMGTPCASWSRALHGPPGSGWCRLRNPGAHVMGLPDLPPPQQLKVDAGNRQMEFTCRVIRLCLRHRVPVYVENPGMSFLWDAPPLARLCALPHHRAHIQDFCGYGARWRKRTRISCWSSCHPDLAERRCHGHGGRCGYTGKPHIILKGVDPVSRRLWTSVAEPYPRAFADAYARHIGRTLDLQRVARLSKLANGPWPEERVRD